MHGYTKAEAARLLGVSRANINYLVGKGHLATVIGSDGHVRITEESLLARFSTHKPENSGPSYPSNADVTRWFAQYLQARGIEPVVAVVEPTHGATGVDFQFSEGGKIYFVEAIGSNPARGTQSSSFRSAAQAAISRISDPDTQVPVILMPLRERRGMPQRAEAWGVLGWRRVFEWFQLWFIASERDGEPTVERTHAMEFDRDRSSHNQNSVEEAVVMMDPTARSRAGVMWTYIEAHPEGVTVDEIYAYLISLGMGFNPVPRDTPTEEVRRHKTAISSQLGHWRRAGRVDKTEVPGQAACLWTIVNSIR